MSRLIVAASSMPPMSTLLSAYDVAVMLRESRIETIGPFHTPLEQQCLKFLLRGPQKITIVPARAFSSGNRLFIDNLWAAVKRGIEEERVLIEPPPGVKGTRMTRRNADIRNAYLLEKADRMLVLTANEESRTAAMAHEALGRGMPVFVMDHPSNAHLLEAGARIATIEALTAPEQR